MKVIQGIVSWVLLISLILGAWAFKEQIPHLIKDFQLKNGENTWLYTGAYFALLCLCLSLPIPFTRLVSISTGALFGFSKSWLLIFLASLFASSVSFLAVRYLFRKPALKFLNKNVPEIVEEVNGNANVYLLVLRFNPLMAFSIVNIIMGISKVKRRNYLIASFFAGIFYGALYGFIGTNIGAAITNEAKLPWQWMAPLLILSLVPLFWRKKIDPIKKGVI